MAGILPQHFVRPPIHLGYRLITGLCGIQTMAQRMSSQGLIHQSTVAKHTHKYIVSNNLLLLDLLAVPQVKFAHMFLT